VDRTGWLGRTFRRARPTGVVAPPAAAGDGTEGDEGIARDGHRAYVGGLWEELGRLQLDFLVGQGLRPHHVLLDIACGSLRAGVHLIPYLEPGHYLGLEKERRLVELGLADELGPVRVAERRPELVIGADFPFHRFSRRPDLSIAQSLFTHLTAEDITLCLGRLRAFVAPGHHLYATYKAGDPAGNPRRSHARHGFRYPVDRLAALGDAAGWSVTEIGDWGHPRGQRMLRFDAG